MKKIKILLVTIFITALSFILIPNVKALSIDLEDSFYMGSYGLYPSNGGNYLTYVKKLSGKYAYCTELKLVVSQSGNYKSYSISDTHVRVSAQIIDNIKAKGYSSKKEYAYIQAALNTYFYKYVGGMFKSNSGNYIDDGVVAKAISDARTTVANTTKTLKSGKISYGSSDNEMNLASSSSSSSFISSKITLSDLQADFNGNKPKYTITVTSTEGTPVICTSTTKCTSSNTYTISNGATKYEFYVKVTGATTTGTVSIKVAGSAKSDYPTSNAYYVSSGYQMVLTYTDGDLSKTSSTSYKLTIPSTTNHTITAYKVDENNNALEGANLKLYTKNSNGGYDEITDFKVDSTGSIFRYSIPIVTTGDDDFYNKEFVLREVNAPDGYKFGENEKKDMDIVITKNSSEKCYNDEGEEVEIGYCQPENYTFACQDSDGVISDYTAGGCGVNTDVGEESDPSEETGDLTDTGSDTSDTGTDDSGNDNGNNDGTPEDTPKEYKTVCILNSSKEVVDDSLCRENQTYIKISNRGGNVTVYKYNQRNVVKISKQDITTHEEISGATLKICKAEDYKNNGVDCDPATTIDGDEMNWKSGTSPAVWNGIPTGDYYIIEVTPPSGYKVATIATPFSMETDGTIKSEESEVTDDTIVINNQLTHIDVDKVSAEDGKNLIGATLAICASTKNEDGTYEILKDREGNYLVITLNDETETEWISDGNTKSIDGLPSGTYFLVEKVAPAGYAESTPIQFSIDNNGVLYDKDGKVIENNKLIVKDNILINQPTGSSIAMIIIIMVVAGAGIYLYKENKLPFNKIIKK